MFDLADSDGFSHIGMPWDFPHRATASDIGVGNRRQRSRSPGREIFSEVGETRPAYRPV